MLSSERILAGVLFSILIPCGRAQFTQQAKLVGTGASPDQFVSQGDSVAVSADGNTVIIGGHDDSGLTGAAWVFTRSNQAWVQQGPKLVPAGATGQQFFGDSVAISGDGNTAVVGAPFNSMNLGAAWVFVRGNGVWSQQAILVGGGATPSAQQGRSVAISGDGNTVAVGGPADGYAGSNVGTGAVWVFTRSNGLWGQQGNKIVGSGAADLSQQGSAIALSADGNTLIVGAPGDGGTGATWVFSRANGAWSQVGAKLVGTGGAGYRQGASVSLSGDGNTAIVGDPSDYGTGALWAFTLANGTWSQEGGKLTASDATSFPSFGTSVALSYGGNLALVGGAGDNKGGGAMWTFVRSGGVWRQQGNKVTGTGAIGGLAQQGASIALSADGSTAILGGPDDNPGSFGPSFLGAAWVFTQPLSPHLAVSAPSSATTGFPVDFSVIAQTATCDTLTGYIGIVHFASSDSSATLPANAPLVNGTGSFSVTFQTGGNQTVAATDATNPSMTGVSGSIAVFSPATHFSVIAPSSVIAGMPFPITVTALDINNHIAATYSGAVHFSSNGTATVLPINSSSFTALELLFNRRWAIP